MKTAKKKKYKKKKYKKEMSTHTVINSLTPVRELLGTIKLCSGSSE